MRISVEEEDATHILKKEIQEHNPGKIKRHLIQKCEIEEATTFSVMEEEPMEREEEVICVDEPKIRRRAKKDNTTGKAPRRYTQKFRKEWKEERKFKGWLREGSTSDRAYCTVCKKELIAGKSELCRHASGQKHKRRLLQRQNPITLPEENMDAENARTISSMMYQHFIDVRSDTVTQPGKEMKNAMFDAPLGDDVFSEDPTVKELEEKVAKLLGKEAALYVPSGTMANLICVMTHCWTRGSEVLLGDQSHLHLWAQGGIAQLGNIHHRSLTNLSDGTFSLSELRARVRGDDPHWPITTLVCVENTHNMMGGKALPLDWLDDLGELCVEFDLSIHMDGARLLNAAVALGVKPDRLVLSCDSVTLCLNKGLGAPVGSLVVSTKEFISRALRVRKVLGGGLHQVGMFAAAGIYALDKIAPKLSLDHCRARAIAQGIQEEHSSAITVDLKEVQTNIVLLHCDNIRVNAKKLCHRLSLSPVEEREELGEQIIVMALPVTDTTARIMTHCDIDEDDVDAVIKKLKYVIREYDNMIYLDYTVTI